MLRRLDCVGGGEKKTVSQTDCRLCLNILPRATKELLQARKKLVCFIFVTSAYGSNHLYLILPFLWAMPRPMMSCLVLIDRLTG